MPDDLMRVSAQGLGLGLGAAAFYCIQRNAFREAGASMGIAFTYIANKPVIDSLVADIANNILIVIQQNPLEMGLMFAASTVAITSWTSERSLFKTVLKSASLASILMIAGLARKSYDERVSFAVASCNHLLVSSDDCIYEHMEWAELVSHAAFATTCYIAGEPWIKLAKSVREYYLQFEDDLNRMQQIVNLIERDDL